MARVLREQERVRVLRGRGELVIGALESVERAEGPWTAEAHRPCPRPALDSGSQHVVQGLIEGEELPQFAVVLTLENTALSGYDIQRDAS